MRAAAVLTLSAFVAASTACTEAPPAAGVECRETRDCEADEMCVDQRCIGENTGVDLDAGSVRDGPPLVLLDGGDTPRDATAEDARGDRDAELPIDAAPALDAAADAASDAATDAAPTDTGPGPTDAAPEDASADAAPFHLDATNSNPEAGTVDAAPPDTGPIDAGPPARGAYDYRRILVPGITSNHELTQLALSPDNLTLLAGERYDLVHAIDVATETTTVSVTLPKDTNEPILVEAIAHAPGGAYVLIAATAYVGPGPMRSLEARLYRTDSFLQGLVEVGTRHAGRAFHSIAFDTASGDAYVLGEQPVTNAYVVTIERWTDSTSTLSFVAQDVVSAGCQDLAIAADGLGGRGLVFTCGINGAVVGVYDSTGVFAYGGNAGNTSHLAARPQGDYAVAVSWSGGRLARFDHGVWTIGFAAPSFGTSSVGNLAFASDGRRALITGQYTGGNAVLREYRDALYTTADLTDVSIPNFDLAPWLGASGVVLNDAVWKDGGDCGFIAGGCSTLSCTRGYLIAFTVLNGRPCP